MTKPAALEFARWLYHEHPDIFVSIARRASPQLSGFADVSDILSSIGSGIGDAFSAVGNFVSNPQNISSLSTVASAYFKSQTPNPNLAMAQGAVFNTQLQRAQYGVSPAAISYQTNAMGQPVPMYNGQQLTPQQLSNLQPSFLQKYGLWLALGGGALVLVLILKS